MKRLPTSPFSKRRPGFTLIEMLTAIVILAVMTLFLGKLAGMASATWLGGQKQANNFTKARAMLDLLARDAQSGIFRGDLSAFPTSSGSTSVAFYTRMPGIPAAPSSTLRNISLVKYEINTNSPTSVLQRGDMAINWTDPAATTIPFGNAPLPENAITMRDAVPGVVAFKVVFVQSSGTTSGIYPATSGTDPVRAMGIAVAVIDDKSLIRLSPSSVASLRSDLANVVTSGTQSTAADWQSYLNAHQSTYPMGLTSGLKIFERYVSLQ